MATGRTTSRWTRVYYEGLDMSGYSRSIGPLSVEFPPVDVTGLSHAIKGYLPDTPIISCGTLNAMFDNTAGSSINVMAAARQGLTVDVMVALGIREAPAQGDPVFCGIFKQLSYQAAEDGGAITATIGLGSAYDAPSIINYWKAWGVLLKAYGAVTAVNAATGVDDVGAASAAGGYMMYQVAGGNGTATIKVQDAANNADGDFADLSGCTTGVIDCTNATSGIIQIGITATVRRYLRWQIVLGTASSVTFTLGFVRG